MQFVRSVPAAILLAVLSAAARADTPPRRPNILIIVGDDLGHADVGFHGCTDIPTPHLDRLARDGVRFTSGYVSGPYCSPTRAGLLTGRYQTRFGHEFNPASADSGLPLAEVTLADRLAAAGYATGLVGKWHLGGTAEMHPQRRGFADFYGFLGGAHDYFDRAGILRGTEPVAKLDYTTDDFGREAVDFIRRQNGKPWFLCLAFNAVHTPMQATEDRLARFAGITDPQRRTYAAMMVAMDDAVGRVREALAATGQDRDTLVAFISDNGGPTMPGTTGNGSRNAPLRGSKRTTLEGGIRVPFVVAWPGRVEPGVYERPVIQLDLHATALAAAGVEPLPEWRLDGVELLPFLSGARKDAPHDALYWRFGGQNAIRAGGWKLVRYDATVDGDRGAGVVGPRLYDLEADVGEARDLAATMPDKVRDLQACWDAWNEANVAPLRGQGDRGGPRRPAGDGRRRRSAATP
ncbi:MAG: sulfatase-like hydrolase/transferase [Planctomycetaceae bacterium]